MPGKLDEINRAIGAIETSVRELQRRADEDRETRDLWYAESREAITALAHKLDQHAAAMEVIRPAVAGLELSRSKLAMWASIGFAGVVVLGWIVEATVKWAIERAWSQLH
jgi:uncharacterized protein involved in exopolysaccharide biosynthesis